MKIKIYQINMDRDVNRVCFISYNNLEQFQGSAEVDSKLYDKVYDKEVDCRNLEAVYLMFNIQHPKDYRGRSLSVSDVVEVCESDTVERGFYFCNDIGFKKISFEPSQCQVSERAIEAEENKISVLLVEPNKYPRMIEIEDTLEAMQEIVGGDIEEYMPYEDEVAIICNEEGKYNGMQPNRAIYIEPEKKIGDKQEMADIVFGKFFICFAPYDSDRFQSLPKVLAEKYGAKFKFPEKFSQQGNEIKAFPFKPKEKEVER